MYLITAYKKEQPGRSLPNGLSVEGCYGTPQTRKVRGHGFHAASQGAIFTYNYHYYINVCYFCQINN